MKGLNYKFLKITVNKWKTQTQHNTCTDKLKPMRQPIGCFLTFKKQQQNFTEDLISTFNENEGIKKEKVHCIMQFGKENKMAMAGFSLFISLFNHG